MNENIEHIISTDSQGRTLKGSNSYRMIIPAAVTPCEFWSVIVYDKATNLIISNGQPWPSVHSHCSRLVKNDDGSIEILFGPITSDTEDSNMIRTLAGKEWYAMLRCYNLQAESTGISWQPDIEICSSDEILTEIKE